MRLFGYDGPVTTFLMKLGDCILLSILWVLFSLPIVTIGASTTALYHAVRKVLREDMNGIWAFFWEGFRENFKQSTIIWLIAMVVFYILGMSAYSAVALYEEGRITVVMLILLGVVLALAVMWALYLFPCVDRFQSTVKQIMKSCAQVAMINFFWSLMLLLIFALSIFLGVILPVGLLIVPGGGMYLSCSILEHVFRKYMDTDTETDAE